MKRVTTLAAEWMVAYLGGHPRFPVQSGPTDGKLRLSSEGFEFVVQGEYLETLFEVPWRDVASWDVEGANVSTRETSGGRAALGALLAGPSGAIIGLAAAKEHFTSVLALAVGKTTIGFLVRDLPPTAVIAKLQSIAGVGPVYQATVNQSRLAWEYATGGLDDLKALGSEGWEAVGVWADGSREAPRVLLKRPFVADQA